MNDPNLFDLWNKQLEKWRQSPKGKKYYKEYHRMMSPKKVDQLYDGYVKQNAARRGISREIMDDTTVEILRTMLQIKREIKNPQPLTQ